MACTPSCIFPTPTQAHCSACHHTFAGIRLFDTHRYGPTQARCCYPPDAIPKYPTRKDPAGVWRSAHRRAFRAGSADGVPTPPVAS